MPCGASGTFPAFSVVENSKPMELVQWPLPTPTGTEVLIQTTYAGVCHSDVHLWEGYFDFGNGVKAPTRQASRDDAYTIGHEFEGRIVAAGDQVPLDQFDMQKSYAVFPWIGCDESDCPACSSGNTNYCKSPKSKRYIDGKTQYGGYASHILVPHHKFLMDYEGALPEGLGCVYMCSGLTAFTALESAFMGKNKPLGGEDLVILGCGGLGFQGLSMACAMYGPPIACDVAEAKLAEAARLGCRTFDASKKESVRAIQKHSRGGVGAVIDFVGTEASFKFASSIIRTGGKVVLVGLIGGRMESPLPMIVFNSMTIEGSLVGNMRQARDMLTLMKTGKVPVVPHHFRSIFEVNNALQDLINGKYVGRCVLKHDWSGPEASKI